ncbi:hypothetical protein HQQ80_18285 [Microbacteriaceae bacterium VKM Ac-2855]|nr:hypothetical protein [Microbacteriaceae bacterium VKM Ac-2855]
MRRRLVAAGAGAALTLALGLISPLSASAYDPSDYPSWTDVQNAKTNEAATAAEVDKITALLDGLRAQAAQLGDEAIQRAAEADAAALALDEATQKVSALEARASAAQADAESARTQAGRLAAQLYRNGGTDATLNLLISGQQANQLLYKLGTMSQLTAQTSRLQDAATTAANLATSLGQQAQEARTQREGLDAAAEAALETAQAAQAAADAQVAEQESRSDELYAQLASLKDTSAEVEKEYADGQAAKASYEQQLAAAQARAEAEAAANNAAAAPAAPATTTNVGQYTGVSGGLSPAESQAYAATQMGSHGWGQDQMSCLIPLWNGESNWRWNALNPSSGAYGIPQSWPASKMATFGADYRTNAVTQINWGLSYIKSAYSSPCNAWAKWQARSPHWY